MPTNIMGLNVATQSAGARFTGTLKTWNDAKGFGFLTPTQGGQDIFVHVSALPKGTGAPRPGQAFTFEIELNREGKKRAVKVQHPGQSAAPVQPRAADRLLSAPARPSPRRGKGLSPWAVGVLLLSTAGFIYAKFSGRLDDANNAAEAPDAPAIMEQPLPMPRTAAPVSPVLNTYRCDGRTRCPQMTSCAEARFFLANCPDVKMDGNGDGEPCEDQWCTGQR